MNWCDGHLDLAYLAVCGRDLAKPCTDRARACVSLPDLRAAGVDLVLATIFTEPDPQGTNDGFAYPGSGSLDAAEAAGLRQLEIYERLEAEGELSIVRGPDDLDRPGPLPRVVLLMEGADPVRSPEHLERWHTRGVRLIGLTWAAGTRYAGGNANHGPLTAAGRDLVDAMDALGLVHDVSHLADAAFDDLLARTRGPIVATHSNCRALLGGEDQRHLRDDQIAALGERDAIIGLNLYGPFLATGRRATIADCVAHVERVAATMGHRRGVALGSDLDGGFGPGDLPERLDHPAHLGRLAEALRAAGWSDEEIGGFARGNWRRFLDRVVG